MVPRQSAPQGSDVLLVEDDPDVSSAYIGFLERHGLRPWHCPAGPQALELSRTRRLCGAIVDLMLPGAMDGFQVCRELQSLPDPVPTLLVTGEFLKEDDRVCGFESGAFAYLHKGFEASEPALCLGHYLDPARPGRRVLRGRRVLIIDDDEEDANPLEERLARDGWQVDRAFSGEQGLLLAHRLLPDAILLDLALPGIEGPEVLACLKAAPRMRRIPVLAWSGRDRTQDKLAMYRSGIRDYLVKGSDDPEIALLKLQRCFAEPDEGEGWLRRGPVTIDPADGRAWLHDESVKGLSRRDCEVLAHLMAHSPKVVPNAAFLARFWPQAESPKAALAALHVHVATLRRALQDAGPCIVTRYGVGLQFDPDAA